MAQAATSLPASTNRGTTRTARSTTTRSTTARSAAGRGPVRTPSATRARTASRTPGGAAAGKAGARKTVARKTVSRKTATRNEVRQIRGTAKGQVHGVAKVAGDDVAGLVGSARNEVGRVGDEVAGQVRGLLMEAGTKLQEQVEIEARRAAGNLGNFGSQAVALAKGRPEQAGPLVDYAQQAADWLESKASVIEDKGADGVAADVADFASRRPGMFLLGAAALGVGVGRLVRAGSLPPASPAPRASTRPKARATAGAR